WVYNYSFKKIKLNANKLINNFNSELDKLQNIEPSIRQSKANSDPAYINWSRKLRRYLKNGQYLENEGDLLSVMYRPFTKKNIFYNREIIEKPGRTVQMFGEKNLAIVIPGKGSSKDFSAFVVNCLPDTNLLDATPKVFFIDDFSLEDTLIDDTNNISQVTMELFQMNREDIFSYVYGILHSKEFRILYSDDLNKKDLRIPLVKNHEAFSKVGSELIHLHTKYESIEAYSNINVKYKSEKPSYKVQKMKFAKERNKEGKLVNDKSTIIFNKDITIKGIPEKAYE